jgi:hypothetical protein
MAEEARAQLAARMKRFADTVSLRQPDRVPVIPWNFHFFPAKQSGMSSADAMVDHERFYAALKDQVLRYEFDMAPACSVYPGPPWEILGLKNWKWPGHGLADDRIFQFVEREIMTAEEYDSFLTDPDGFTARVVFPRTTSLLEPLGMMPPLHWYFNFPYLLGPFLGMPAFASMLDGLVKVGQEWNRHAAASGACYAELEALGYPKSYGSVAFTGFDTVSLWLRGNRGTMLDMYRQPDKLLAATEICSAMQTQLAIIQCQISGNPRVSLFVYRGAEGFMSDAQFERFFWPTLRAQVQAILEAGCVPMLFLEGDFTPRLKYIAELPRGQVPLHFDRVDRARARQFLAGRNCFWGNIPVSIMEHGTPQQVEEDVRQLIDLFAADCGLIVDSAGCITDDARAENVQAMVEAVHKYGVR